MLKIRHEAFKYYFYFMQERMKIFHNQYACNQYFKIDDEILLQHKFTNVYRSCDRVSQYLISEIIGFKNKNMSDLDIALNIILFKVFNNIQTWEYLKKKYGKVCIESFDYKKISHLLTSRKKNNIIIFNGAYIMTASSNKYQHHTYKHERWLNMIDKEFINERKLDKLLDLKSMSEVYDILKSCTFIGPFLAYQYAIDLNYSNVINFSENSFVKAGIGAIRGIKKCFIDSDKSYEYIIKHTQENMKKYNERYNYSFDNLFGRSPTLIDLQNCFCETDKYLRVKKPELNIGNTRIKQKYRKNKKKIDYIFPEKWNLII